MKEISLFCRQCKKSLGISMPITGNTDNAVLEGYTLKCDRCKKVSIIKNFTEGSVVARMTKDFKFYV